MTFDIREYLIEQNDARRNELITEGRGRDVLDSEGRKGKIVGSNRDYATIRWKDGETDKVAHYELERKKDHWFWRI